MTRRTVKAYHSELRLVAQLRVCAQHNTTQSVPTNVAKHVQRNLDSGEQGRMKQRDERTPRQRLAHVVVRREHVARLDDHVRGAPV
jgi:hypothetical protein